MTLYSSICYVTVKLWNHRRARVHRGRVSYRTQGLYMHFLSFRLLLF